MRCKTCGRFMRSSCEHCLRLWDPQRDVKLAVAKALYVDEIKRNESADIRYKSLVREGCAYVLILLSLGWGLGYLTWGLR